MKIQLLVLDLDDTLLNSERCISPANLSALQKAGERGVKIMLASGRPPEGMERFAHEIGLEYSPGFMICYNGSIIYDLNNSCVYHEEQITHEDALQVFDLLEEFGLPVQYYNNNSIVASRFNDFTELDGRICSLPVSYPARFRETITGGVTKMLMPGSGVILDQAIEKLIREMGTRLRVIRSRPYFFEILPINVDKGLALEKVSGILGIKQSHIMAVGDAPNDLGMIRWAGWGTAIGNADDCIKDAARIIAGFRHDEDGVARVIEDYILDAVSL